MLRRRRTRTAWVAVVLSVLAMAISVATLVIRALPLTDIYVLVVAVGAPYVALVAAFGLILAALSRRVVLSILAVIVLVATLGVQLRWYYAGEPVAVASGDVELRLLSSNLRYGRANAESFVDLANSGADVVTVSELTSEAVQRFYAAGIGEKFPYSMLLPSPGAGGNGIWSRHPLSVVSPTRFWSSGMIAAYVQVPGVASPPVLASVHIHSPVADGSKRSFESWRNAIAATQSRMGGLIDAGGPGAVVVAGDFNSTPDMRQFRDLLTSGYRDAVRQSGSGFAPTFPSSGGRLFPLITIDHVVTRGAGVSSVRTVSVAGADHRAVLATLGIPAA